MTDDAAVLDRPVWSALQGRDAEYALGSANALRYRADVSPFAAISGPSVGQALDELAAFASAERPVALFDAGPLSGWTPVVSLRVLQMTAPRVAPPRRGPGQTVALGEGDIGDMVELAAISKPGPFHERTVELGGYLGVRDNGRLIAMGGERMHPTGWSEISAVCTHPAYRGRGLGARVLMAVADKIRAREERPFLHVALDNSGAIRLYKALGFEGRREFTFDVVYPG
jgi:ribosomal protein S18 acetylase RimI-like enzyme